MSTYHKEQLLAMSPKQFRDVIRKGDWTDGTTQIFQNYAQANLVVVPKDYAFDFLVFCSRNPESCPVLDVTEVGDPCPRLTAPEADPRTDLPKYRPGLKQSKAGVSAS